MKQTTIGVFEERTDAEKAIDTVYKQLNIPADDISFLYRNTDGEVKEVKTDLLVENDTTSTIGVNLTMGVLGGAVLGALAGAAAILGFAPIFNSVVAIGALESILTFLGVSGALAVFVGTTLLGAFIGAIVGVAAELIIGGASSVRAYSDQAEPKNVVVAVIAPERTDVLSLFRTLGAFDTRVYRLSI